MKIFPVFFNLAISFFFSSWYRKAAAVLGRWHCSGLRRFGELPAFEADAMGRSRMLAPFKFFIPQLKRNFPTHSYPWRTSLLPFPAQAFLCQQTTGSNQSPTSPVIQLLSHVSSPFYSKEHPMCAKPTILKGFLKQRHNQWPFLRAFLSLFTKVQCSEHLLIQFLLSQLRRMLDRLSIITWLLSQQFLLNDGV